MPTPSLRPTLDRTLYTQRHAIGVALLIGGFLLLLALYQMVDRLQALRQEAARFAQTEVVMPAFRATLPGAWHHYTKFGDALVLHATEDETGAFAMLRATTLPAFRFRALDTNPAFVARKLAKVYATFFGKDETFDILGVESVPFLPRVPAVRVWFTLNNPYRQGRATLFYLEDTQYLFWGIRGEGDPEGAELARFLSGSSGAVVLPGTRDRYARPVIHSGKITYAESREASEAAERELVLAQAYADRIGILKGREAVDVVPALMHFRKAVQLLASVRREDSLLSSDLPERFVRLAQQRETQVVAWFDQLERAQKMGDLVAVRAQATEIVNGATLEGEAEYRLRAQMILRDLPEPSVQ